MRDFIPTGVGEKHINKAFDSKYEEIRPVPQFRFSYYFIVPFLQEIFLVVTRCIVSSVLFQHSLFLGLTKSNSEHLATNTVHFYQLPPIIMPSFKDFAWSTMVLLAFGVQSNLASPTSSSNITVMIRDDNFAYHQSEEMANIVLARNSETSLVKRSYATVQACRTSSCTDCTTVFDGSLASPSACIPAENTACLIVSNLEDATIWNWNHAGCNGHNTDHRGCPTGENTFGAAGTNSIGVHPGC